MAGQSITFDFLTTGADKTASGFRKVADNTVLAARGAKVLSNVIETLGDKEGRTAEESVLLAKALRLTGVAEDRVAARAVVADVAIRRLGDAMQDSSRHTAEASIGLAGLGTTLGHTSTGFLGLIGAGVALSPVIATLGVGFGGLGLAALGVSKNTKLMAAELAPLKAEFAGFTAALQPTVLEVFNTGIKLAGGLLHDIQPVAEATGKAFDGFLGTVDAEFRSRTWQDFFGFMAAQAGPDMRLLGDAIVPLLDMLPRLLTDIQPLAVELLKTADGAVRLADAAVALNDKVKNLGSQADHSGGLVGRLADAAKRAFDQMFPGVGAAQKLASGLGQVGAGSDKAGKSTQAAGEAFKGAWPKAQSYAQWVAASAKATTALADAQDKAVSTQLAYGNDILTSANDAQTFHDKLAASKGMIGLHTQAQRDSFGAANTYIGDLSRQATTAIQSGHGTDAAIGAIRRGLPALESAKTHNRQYWEEVRTLVNYLHQLSLQKFINTGIHVTGAGKWSVTGTTITPGVAHGPQNIGAAPGGFAAGAYINRGAGPTADDVLIRASRGELVVPAYMVKAGAVDHLRGAIPGFAAGGVAGSYGPGAVSGLPRWTGGRIRATDTAIAQNTAQAIVNAMAAAQAAAKAAQAAAGAGVSGAGPVGGDAGANKALARQMFPWDASQWPAFNTLEMHEAGYNRFARNPSSGAYGIPQAYPPTKMPFAAQAAGGSHAGPQLSWMYAYIRSAYITPARAWAQYYNHPGGEGSYARGGLVPGYASGGTVARQGAAWLHAWRSRHGGGFGAAWGPKVLNEQIPEMAAAAGRARTLAGATGLTPGQHRYWAARAADETKRLGVLRRELAVERAWRGQLGASDATLTREIAAAAHLPHLAGAVRGWKSQITRQKATITGISRMLGYSDAHLAAYAKAHPKPAGPPVSPVPVTHTYGGDVADTIGTVLSAALGPFTGAARGGLVSYDRGGWLRPGATMAWNGTGRPEQVLPARGGGGRLQVEWVGGDGGDELTRWIKKNVRIRGGTGPGAVDRAFGSR